MPSSTRRRTLRKTAAGLTAAVAVAGCLAPTDDDADETDDTDRDYLVVENSTDAEREVSLVVRRGTERVVGGRYRFPPDADARYEDGFPWGAYEVHAKLHDDIANWQSWAWEPHSCARSTADDADPDQRMTAVVTIRSDDCRFQVGGCGRNMPGGPSGGGGGYDTDDPRTPMSDYRVGDVETPPE